MLVKVLSTALPVFVALGLGILCRTKHIISREGMDAIRNVAVNITLPVVLFASFASANYSPETIMIPIGTFIISAIGLIIGYLLKKPLKQGHCFPFIMTGFEGGMLGYGLYALLFKGQSNAHLALLDLGNAAFVFTIYKALICGKGQAKAAIKSAVYSPTLWGIILGVILGSTGLYTKMEPSGCQEILNSVTTFIAAPTSMLILLSIGYDLDFSHVHWKNVLTIVVMRELVMAVMFIMFLLLNRNFVGGKVAIGTLILWCLLPTTYIVPIFADNDDERADVSTAISLSTLLCLLGFTILAAFV